MVADMHAAVGWAGFLALTAAHLAACSAALRCLQLDSVNHHRLRLLLARRYHAAGKTAAGGTIENSSSSGSRNSQQPREAGGLPLPADISDRETLLAPPLEALLNASKRCAGWRPRCHIVYGCSALQAAAAVPPLLPRLFSDGGALYVVGIETMRRPAVLVAVRHSGTSAAAGAAAAAKDHLRAYTHAIVTALELDNEINQLGSAELSAGDAAAAAARADAWMAARYDAFVEDAAKAGWRLDKVLLPAAICTLESGKEE